MRFGWKALLIAPLLLPLIGSLLAAPLMRGDGPVILTFLGLLIPSSVISYSATLFLLLPALFLLSLVMRVTGWKVCLLGFALGAAMIVPITFLAWATSGPDSGPPVENFLTFFVRWTFDPFMLFFPTAGLVTAALYWWLLTRHNSPANLPAPKN
jgi:hypothetical protein